MTYIDPPTEASFQVRKIPIKVYCDFKVACEKNRKGMRAEIIRLMELYAKTGGKVLDRSLEW